MAINIIQNPTGENSGMGKNVTFKTEIADQPFLPESFALVPALSMNASATKLPHWKMEDYKDHLQPAIAAESAWIENAMPLMRERILNEQAISWTAYHAKLQPQVLDPLAIIASLPLFFKKADTPAMIKHGMNIVKEITSYLNPGQIPVLACDCPIFEKCECIQWKWPATHGEDKMIIMFGGLLLEKGLWIALGDLLASSGWTDALTDTAIATVGTADSFLKCMHITRTRHAHQLTTLALSILRKNGYDSIRGDSSLEEPFEEWSSKMIKKSPTFLYWDLILKIEALVLIFIRAHGEKNFPLYVKDLDALMFMFFAVDHYSYSRWVSVHIRDMKSLPEDVKEDFLEELGCSENMSAFFSNTP